MADISADKLVVYAVIGADGLKTSKIITQVPSGVALEQRIKSRKNLVHALLGTRDLAARKVVVYGVLGPGEPMVDNAGGPDPDVLPPDQCNEVGNPNCCVPDLNRVIEARVGVLDTHHDLVVAIQYLQDRHNVLVREFNKLALVTRSNPPSV